ncbi:MAG TPA: SulP family inorganic anion transporter, partial [Burkholderiaceae bacterium]
MDAAIVGVQRICMDLRLFGKAACALQLDETTLIVSFSWRRASIPKSALDPTYRPVGTVFARADLLAGLSIAGLLLPEAVAYSGIAGLPPQAGVVALLAGLVCYGL